MHWEGTPSAPKRIKIKTTHHLRGALGVGRGNFLERAEEHQLGLLLGTTATRRAAASGGSDSLAQLFHLLLEVLGYVTFTERFDFIEHLGDEWTSEKTWGVVCVCVGSEGRYLSRWLCLRYG